MHEGSSPKAGDWWLVPPAASRRGQQGAVAAAERVGRERSAERRRSRTAPRRSGSVSSPPLPRDEPLAAGTERIQRRRNVRAWRTYVLFVMCTLNCNSDG